MWASWCGPCKIIAPFLEDLSKTNPSVKFVKLNVEELPEIASKYGVISIPTVIYFKNGKDVYQDVGALPKGKYEENIQTYLTTSVEKTSDSVAPKPVSKKKK